MIPYLLDVNVLIGLIDPSHVHHDRAHRWFEEAGQLGWLSCPTTQNGVLRIVSSPRYSNSQPMASVLESLASLVMAGNHSFVPDSISLLGDVIDHLRLLSSGQVTDTYLLALAKANDARLATFDTKIVTSAVADGSRTLFQIP